MTFRLLVRSSAQAEIRNAWQWYEERKLGLGDRLEFALDGVFDRICDNPFQYQEIYPTVHRAPLGDFPYGVFYRVHGNVVSVIAFFHARRDPKQWQHRV